MKPNQQKLLWKWNSKIMQIPRYIHDDLLQSLVTVFNQEIHLCSYMKNNNLVLYNFNYHLWQAIVFLELAIDKVKVNFMNEFVTCKKYWCFFLLLTSWIPSSCVKNICDLFFLRICFKHIQVYKTHHNDMDERLWEVLIAYAHGRGGTRMQELVSLRDREYVLLTWSVDSIGWRKFMQRHEVWYLRK